MWPPFDKSCLSPCLLDLAVIGHTFNHYFKEIVAIFAVFILLPIWHFSQAVFDSKRNNRVLSRRCLYNPLCAYNRVCWTKTPKFSWDSGLDFLHLFTYDPEWIGIWNTWMENFVNCYSCPSIFTFDILEVRKIKSWGWDKIITWK